MKERIGPFQLNRVAHGDCLELAADLPDESIDVLVTSPPYWGQRMSSGVGAEVDPRHYVDMLCCPIGNPLLFFHVLLADDGDAEGVSRWGVEVRVHGVSQSPSLYRFDDECLIAPNVYGTSAARSPVIRIRRMGGDDLFRTYLDGWENIWANAHLPET